MSHVDPSATKSMRALILVGGFGTRLRPLTLSVPKPLVPFCNKPMIIHQVEALKEAGVTDIILAVAYRPDAMKAEMDEWAAKLGVRFIFSHETEPLGTAGPLALAAEELLKDDEPFFVLNSDVTCKFPLKELLGFHRQHGGEGTIMVTKVTEWQKYGVVVYNEDKGDIDQFVEKPKKFVGDKINAGIYCFNKSILKRIKVEKTSIETQVFPQMAAAKQLFAMELEGFWMDIGQPHDYLDGIGKFLPSLIGTKREDDSIVHEDKSKGKLHYQVIGCVMVHPTATIGAGSVLGPNVTIGAGVVVGPATRIIHSAIFDKCRIGKGVYINKSIIAWSSSVGDFCRIGNDTVLGEDVHVKEELFINGAKVLPNKNLNVNVLEPQVIM